MPLLHLLFISPKYTCIIKVNHEVNLNHDCNDTQLIFYIFG